MNENYYNIVAGIKWFYTFTVFDTNSLGPGKSVVIVNNLVALTHKTFMTACLHNNVMLLLLLSVRKHYLSSLDISVYSADISGPNVPSWNEYLHASSCCCVCFFLSRNFCWVQMNVSSLILSLTLI